jgi:3-oxoacyl-[acyl-carrier protein] reductase
MDLAHDVALVTGASRGIGRAIAMELGRRGATIVGTATSEAGAQTITQTFAAAGLKGRGLVLNVATQASVDALLAQLDPRQFVAADEAG